MIKLFFLLCMLINTVFAEDVKMSEIQSGRLELKVLNLDAVMKVNSDSDFSFINGKLVQDFSPYMNEIRSGVAICSVALYSGKTIADLENVLANDHSPIETMNVSRPRLVANFGDNTIQIGCTKVVGTSFNLSEIQKAYKGIIELKIKKE